MKRWHFEAAGWFALLALGAVMLAYGITEAVR